MAVLELIICYGGFDITFIIACRKDQFGETI